MPNDAAVTGVHSHIRHPSSVIAHNRRLFAGVVSGIAHYGNCIGVPTIGGEVQVFFWGKMNGCRARRQLSWNGG